MKVRGAPDALGDAPHTVVVLGAGLMGAQIGLEYALGGFNVVLVTRTPASHDRALRRVRGAGDLLVRSDLLLADERDRGQRRISVTSEPDADLSRAAIIVESVDEDFELKADLLGRAARLNPSATLASNTSALSITKLGEAIGAPDRLIGTHYWNPPTLMPLVEVVPGAHADPERVQSVEHLLRDLGKEPLIVKDVPGFVWNRLQLALVREAVALVRDGITTADVIDEIARRGFGRRWNLIGPFAAMAAGGASTVARVADLIYPTLAADVRGDDILALTLPEGEDLEQQLARRNERLAHQLSEDRMERKKGVTR